MDKKSRIEELVKLLNEYSYLYYTMDAPKVSDVEYDRLYDELIALEGETGLVLQDSPSRRVGGDVLDKFVKHTHLGKLWSLDKAQDKASLRSWDIRINKLINEYNNSHIDRLPKPEYILEYKFDGLTVNLTYDNGILVQGASRGNGSKSRIKRMSKNNFNNCNSTYKYRRKSLDRRRVV